MDDAPTTAGGPGMLHTAATVATDRSVRFSGSFKHHVAPVHLETLAQRLKRELSLAVGGPVELEVWLADQEDGEAHA